MIIKICVILKALFTKKKEKKKEEKEKEGKKINIVHFLFLDR